MLLSCDNPEYNCHVDGDEEREPDVECVVKGAVITTCEWRCCLIGKTRTTFSSPRNKLSSSASFARRITWTSVGSTL